ncbi:MAG TPA: DUF4340 domain-containing protein [Polyangiaceae bacterium]
MKARAMVTPIVLVVLAGAAVAYAYLVDRGTVSDADRAARRSDVFPSFRADDVTHIELSHGSESLVLERDADASRAGASWTLTSPTHERADSAAVDALLRELELATRLREVADGDPVGLDAPRARGKLKVGALEYRFALGAEAPRPEGAAYMRLDGEGTFVVGRSVKVQLLRGADAYRDRTLVPYGASDVERLEVRAASGGGFALERKGATFRVAGEGLRASRAAVEHLLAVLSDARAESFLDDSTAERATSAPAFVVTLVPREGERPRVELRLGGECPGQAEDVVVVRTSPTHVSACAARELAEALATTAGALIDTSPLFAHADEIEELRLEPTSPGGARVDLARRGGGWHERAPEDRDLSSDETDSANALTLALAEARALDVRRTAPDERFEVRARATIVRTGGATNEVIELAAPGADGVRSLRRADDGAVLRVSLAVSRRFEPHPAALRSRAIWRVPIDTGSVVGVDDTCGPTAQRLELRDRTWIMRAPAGLLADAGSVADLAGAVAHARVDAWLAEADDGTFGLERPGACTVTLALAPASGDAAPRRATVVFGAEGEGGIYARTLDEPDVFLAPKTLRDLAAHPAIDRSRFHLDPASLEGAVVLHDGARRSLRADAGDDGKLAAALGGLYAQNAVHAGPAAHEEGLDRPTLEILATTRSDAGTPVETRLLIGAPTTSGDVDFYFARVAGLDATFSVPRAAVTSILDAL